MIDRTKCDELGVKQAATEPAWGQLKQPAKKSRTKAPAKELSIPESYELVVTCRDENNQRALYERLASEGYDCRVLTM